MVTILLYLVMYEAPFITANEICTTIFKETLMMIEIEVQAWSDNVTFGSVDAITNSHTMRY